jgi:hypothetical protein
VHGSMVAGDSDVSDSSGSGSGDDASDGSEDKVTVACSRGVAL